MPHKMFCHSYAILFVLLLSHVVFVSNFKLDASDTTLEILFSEESFKEIDQDVLQMIGNSSEVSLSCHLASNKTRRVKWSYQVSELYSDRFGFNRVVDGDFHNMSMSMNNATPPVVRLTCDLKDTTGVSKDTLIYTGVDTPPYIYKNKELVRAIVINETMAVFPCLLRYPIDHSTKDMALQLLKDGRVVKNVNYIPESGYILDLKNVTETELFGTFHCLVLNSTGNDFVHIAFNEGSYLRLKYKGYSKHVFHERVPEQQAFECSAPKSMFKEGFRWYYQMRNGSLTEIHPKRNISSSHESHPSPNQLQELVQIRFATREITHVVCTGESTKSETFESSVRVNVQETTPTVTLKDPGLTRVKYTKGTQLNCTAIGHSVNFRWLRDGQNLTGVTIYDHFASTNLSTTVLALQPSVDDSITNYTCCGSNYWNQACKTFIVHVGRDSNEYYWTVYSLVALLGIMAVISAVMLTFGVLIFEIPISHLYPDEEIKKFLKGCRPIAGEPKAFSKSFDKTKIIKDNCIQIEESMGVKEGEFAKVDFGWLMADGRYDTLIARKRLKIPEKGKESAFSNFLKEIKLFASLPEHPNLVKFIGATASIKNLKKYKACAIMEYCHGGDLSSYLTKHVDKFDNSDSRVLSNGKSFSQMHLIKWALEISHGMEYLHSREIVHMDLATRNILLYLNAYDVTLKESIDPGLLTAKIGDLGMSRDLKSLSSNYYQLPENRHLPIKTFSPDTIKDLKFYPKSDIWSMGLLYYDMFSLGKSAYSFGDGKITAQKVLEVLTSDEPLYPPQFAPPKMWEIIRKCLEKKPSDRPTCTDIATSLQELKDSFQVPSMQTRSSSKLEIVDVSQIFSILMNAEKSEYEKIELNATLYQNVDDKSTECTVAETSQASCLPVNCKLNQPIKYSVGNNFVKLSPKIPSQYSQVRNIE